MPKRRRRRGEGSVYYQSRDRRWIARYQLGNGRSKRVSALTELGAKQELERLRRAYSSDVDPAHGSLDDYLADWLNGLQNVRQATRVSYAGHVHNHISPLLGGVPVARLRPADVRRMVTDRLAAGLSPSTVRRIHSTLHAALAQGVRERTLTDNAAHGISLPRVEDRLVEAMTEDRADQIRDAVAGTFLEPVVELLLGSGLRLGEALGLDQGDVQGNVVTVRHSKTRMRAVVVSDDAAEALRRHVALRQVRGAKEPVFVGPRTHRRLNTWTVTHAFPRMLEAAGLPRMRVHDLRHATATLLVAKGVHMKQVSAQLGHSSVSTTDRYYAHVAPSVLEDNVKLLNRRKG